MQVKQVEWTLEELEAAIERVRRDKVEKPSRVALERVAVAPPGILQHRRPYPGDTMPQQHIRSLAQLLERSVELDPILVVRADDVWVVVDGHHRVAAYEKAGREDVPVEVFEGNLMQARVQAGRGNTRDKLPMSKREKMEAAWSLTRDHPFKRGPQDGEGLSKQEVAEAAGVGTAVVGKMRRRLKELRKIGVDVQELTWGQALTYGRDRKEWTEEEVEQQVEMWTARLRDHFATAPSSPGMFARALEEFSPNLVERLMGEWRDRHVEDDDLDF